MSKGVPSTFANIKGLYNDGAKKEIIQELVTGYLSDHEQAAVNGPTAHVNGVDHSKLKLSATVFLAQHHDYYRSRNLDKAMSFVEKALESKPDSVDYHMLKARIWKHRGNPKTASESMDYACSLDERDRYINTKAAKYRLRDHKNAAALETMSKFTKNDVPAGPLGDLHDMQGVWYITEDGESYARQGKWGLALKRFHAICDIFDVWVEDQFDFHSFSMRKGQVRAYVDLLRWEDRLRSHPFFSRAAIRAIQIYAFLYDQAQSGHGALTNGEVDGDGKGGDSDRKKVKAMKKAKREQQKEDKKIEEAITGKMQQDGLSNATTKSTTSKGPHKIEADPLGMKLLETAEPLKDVMRFLRPLLEMTPELIDGQLMGFEIFFRRSGSFSSLRKLVHAMKMLKLYSEQKNTSSPSAVYTPPPKWTEIIRFFISRSSASIDMVRHASRPFSYGKFFSRVSKTAIFTSYQNDIG